MLRIYDALRRMRCNDLGRRLGAANGMMELEVFERLGLALALGLLIGLERGWHRREAPEHGRVAGIRTFGLIGLGGGLSALMFAPAWSVTLGLVFAGFAAVIAVGHYVAAGRTGDLSVTSGVAALLTFVLGGLAVAGSAPVAAAAAVVVTLLLSVKPILHGWLQRIEYGELMAALKLLLISVVALPLLPNRGFGPWQALNPFELWWMVVLIAALSFCGYLAMRIVGPARGALLTALLGGLTSSTAATVSLARLARGNVGREDLMTAGAAVASGTMLIRIVVLLAALNLPLLRELAAPLLASAATIYGAALWLWRRPGGGEPEQALQLGNPFELGAALKFGAFLALVVLAIRAAEAWIGAEGIVAVAAISGLADVDAISLSMARVAGESQPVALGALAIALAALVNAGVKAAIPAALGSRPMAYKLGGLFAVAAIAALLAALAQRLILPAI
jgi:uncharacterized membrane protein (DUF4010 family)